MQAFLGERDTWPALDTWSFRIQDNVNKSNPSAWMWQSEGSPNHRRSVAPPRETIFLNPVTGVAALLGT